ncbi:hypothetical protein [Lysobacter sp. CA199]|uniref:hypothetical protein n=1 Tax=Lysobacter sp. CA199 TaxID=3455608 RepID=UPI003F8D09B7
MTLDPDRRRIVQLSLLAVAAHAVPAGLARAATAGADTDADAEDPARAFDFFVGRWHARYRRLKERLLDSHDWEEFEGECQVQPLFGGLAQTDESDVARPAQPYRGFSLRSFDPASKTWADWWLDTRNPHKIAAPMLGRFDDGVGTFFGDSTLRDKPVKVRGVWSKITANSAQWEQAFSPDGGKTWESNWVSSYRRTG